MTKQEIDKLFIEGNPIVTLFYMSGVKHQILTNSISEKQMQAFRKRFNGKYETKVNYGGLTTHETYYTGDLNE